MIGWGGIHFQVSGLGHQAPGSGFQVRVQLQEICHRFSHLSSVIDPVIVSGGGWQPRVAGGGKSALCHRSSIQPSILHRYVVTRSRPYPARRSREVEAVSGWRSGTQPRQLGQHAVLPLPQGMHSPDTRYSILDTLSIPPSPLPLR